jgi:hypothetical protein
LQAISQRLIVGATSQKRQSQNDRRRLASRGLARFEVLGLEVDRELIRALAKRLTRNDEEANRIRAEVGRKVSNKPPKGGILASLRRSPLVGADLDLGRSSEAGREVDE